MLPRRLSRRRPRWHLAVRATTRPWRRFVGRRRLNKQGSEKDTWHLDFDLTEVRASIMWSAIAFGIVPKNDPGAGRRR